jgi:hypothetical protein
MNIFWIIIGSILFLAIFLLIIIFGALSKGIDQKFGREWIPKELHLNFNHFNISKENEEKIEFYLSDSEKEDILDQISILIASYDSVEITPSSFSFQKCRWLKIEEATFECREIETSKLKAVISTLTKELVYFK